MRFIHAIFLVVATFGNTAFGNCDSLYSQRGDSLLLAVDCYQSLTPPEFARSMIALSAIIHDYPKTQQESDAIARGLLLVEEFAKKSPESGELFYWRACMNSFSAQLKDRGSVIPRATIRALKSIQSDLMKADALDPSQHAYGPARVLGLIHTQLPGILGGDREFAEKILKAAFEGNPRFSANWIAHAKILIVLRKRDEAYSILSRFETLSDAELNPYPEAERFPSLETASDRIEAKRLLSTLPR